LDRNSPTALASGCLIDTSGAAFAPRCFSRKPTFVASAHSRDRRIPIWIVKSAMKVGYIGGVPQTLSSSYRPPRLPL
jgi:hypothetical protein